MTSDFEFELHGTQLDYFLSFVVGVWYKNDDIHLLCGQQRWTLQSITIDDHMDDSNES